MKTSEALATYHLQSTVTMAIGFIRYNKTFIACGFRKYENVFTQEYHVPLGRCPQGICHSWVNTCNTCILDRRLFLLFLDNLEFVFGLFGISGEPHYTSIVIKYKINLHSEKLVKGSFSYLCL